MQFSSETLVSILAAIIALVSALFAWQAVRTAEKTYTIDLIGQLYSLYQSDEMLKNLKICWACYRRLWISESESEDIGIAKATNGTPVPLEPAVVFFKNLDMESDEFKAIHYAINYWTYLELLLRRKSLSPFEITAFTSPYILGFLMPMVKAYSKRFPDPVGQDSTLEYAYEVLLQQRQR